jgi:hypothetical protein
MQEVDAQRRLAILRGEAPPPIEDEGETELEIAPDTSGDARSTFPGSGRRRRKRPGEDDTEFELRLAKERNDATYAIVESSRKPVSSAPIVDHAGHIDLFGDERARAHAEKNPEAEADRKKKEREYEDQYTMRFSNAAGKDGISQPWYSHGEGVAPDVSTKNVWGRDDPDRKSRDTQRINSSDPLAMMKKERRKIQEERDEELRQLRKDSSHRERHRDRHSQREAQDRGRHSDTKRHDSRRARSKDRDSDSRRRYDDHHERRRHKEEERRKRHRDSRSRSPDRRRHRHRRDER